MIATLTFPAFDVKPTVKQCTDALAAVGFKDARQVAVTYGVADCVAVLAYVSVQRGGYAAKSPGALARWILRHRHQLTGWHWRRIAGFLKRFRALPEYLAERIKGWLSMTQGEYTRTADAKVEHWLVKEMEEKWGRRAVAKARTRTELFSVWRKALEHTRNADFSTLRDCMDAAIRTDTNERAGMRQRDEGYARDVGMPEAQPAPPRGPAKTLADLEEEYERSLREGS